MSALRRHTTIRIPSLVALPGGVACGAAPEEADELAPAFAEFDSLNSDGLGKPEASLVQQGDWPRPPPLSLP